MASGGNGSSPHVFGELFQIMTGTELVHVPYRAAYIPDLISGQVQVVFSPIPQVLELIRTGQLRALAAATPKRLESLLEDQTISRLVPRST